MRRIDKYRVFKYSVLITALSVIFVFLLLIRVPAEEIPDTEPPPSETSDTGTPVPESPVPESPVPETPAPESPSPTPTPTPFNSYTDDIQSQLNDIYNKINSMEDQQYIPPEPPQPTEKPIAAPLVKVLSPQTVTMAAGRMADVTVTLKNVGTSHAYSVLTQVKPSGDSVFSVTFPDGSNVNNIISENSEVNVKLRLAVDKTAKPGSYAVDIVNSYRDIYGVNLSETDSIFIKVENQNYGTGIQLKDFNISGSAISPGDMFTLGVTLSNSGPFEATGLSVEIDGLAADGIYMTGSSGIFRASFPGGSEENLTYKLYAAKKAQASTYPLTFTLKYMDSAGQAQSADYKYYIAVIPGNGTDGGGGAANVEITSLTGPSDAYGVGEPFSVQMTVTNTGDATAKRVKVTADSGEAIVPVSANIKFLNRLAAGESADMAFSFAANETAKTQTYMIHFNLVFETGDTVESDKATVNETISADQYAGVSIYNPPVPTETPAPSPNPDDAKKISKPKMIVAAYKTDPAIVSAGKSFTLSLDFQNTHKTKTVSNLKIVLSAVESAGDSGSVFSPVDSSNTIFISEIPPQGIVSKTLKMMAAPGAQPRSYSISVKFAYQDEEFLEYEEEENIGITVKQVTRLEIGDLGLPADGMAGQQMSIYCNIINSGRVALNNLRVSVESEGMDTAGASVYLGKLMDGSSTYYEGTLTPKSPGAITGKLIVSAEDDAGVVTQLSQDFEVQIQDLGTGMGMPDYTDAQIPQEAPVNAGISGTAQALFMQYWKLIAAGVGLIIIIVIIRKIVKRRRKQKSWEIDE